MKVPRSILLYRILSLLILLSIIVACGGPSTTDQEPGDLGDEDAPVGELTEPEEGGEFDVASTCGGSVIVIGAKATPQGVDTSFHNSLESMQAFRNVLDPIMAFNVVLDANGEWTQDFLDIKCRLCESYEISNEGRTITYKLKEGVLSPAGNELTAEDVKWTFEREFALEAIGTFFAHVVGRLDSADDVKVIDKYTVSFTTPEPNPIGLVWSTHSFNGIYDSIEAMKHTTEEDPWAVDWVSNNGVGFGPWTIGKWDAGQEVVFVRHEDYHGEKPNVKCIVYREVPNSANRLALLQAGEIDIAEQLTPKERIQLADTPGVKVHSWAGNIMAHFEMNVDMPPFDNKLVRQGMNYAFPYEEALESIYFGTAQQATSVNPSTYPDFYGDETWDFYTDLDKAKELFEEAGFPEGFEFDLVTDAGVPEHELAAILLQTNLEKIGVTANIVKMPTGDFYARLLKNEFPMFVWQDMPGIPDGGFGIALWIVGGSAINHSNFDDPEVNELYKTSASTLDADIRSDAFRRIQEILIDESPWLYIAETGWHIAARDNIDGIVWFPLQDIRWNYLEKE